MAETRMNTGPKKKRNSSDSSGSSVPILNLESEQFSARIKEVLGDESVSSFARRCEFSDSLLGAYIRGEKSPGLEKLIAIANAGSVTVDWLATGRLPKTRAELRTASRQSQSQTEGLGDDDSEMLQAVIRVSEHALRRADVSIEVAQRVEEAATAMAAKAQRWPELAARLEAARAAAALFRTTQQATTRD